MRTHTNLYRALPVGCAAHLDLRDACQPWRGAAILPTSCEQSRCREVSLPMASRGCSEPPRGPWDGLLFLCALQQHIIKAVYTPWGGYNEVDAHMPA